jgi:molecular chaperone GrpE
MSEEDKKISEDKKEKPADDVNEDELSKCQKQRDEYLDGWKRAKADFINYQKEEIKRFESILKFANEELVKDLIPVLDSFDLSLTVLESQGLAEKGMYLVKSQLEDILKKRGLESIKVVGEKFDPAFHEAIAEVEAKGEPGIIVEEIEKGYKLNGKVIRAARVKIAK